MKLLLLMVAGALGAASRYGLTLLMQGWLAQRGSRTFLVVALGVTFPLATLVINVTGSLLLSFLTPLELHDFVKRPSAEFGHRFPGSLHDIFHF